MILLIIGALIALFGFLYIIYSWEEGPYYEVDFGYLLGGVLILDGILMMYIGIG